MLTSYRDLITVNGFSTKPTAVRAMAPATRLPWLESRGRAEALLGVSLTIGGELGEGDEGEAALGGSGAAAREAVKKPVRARP